MGGEERKAYSCGNVDCSVWDVEVSDYEDESGRHDEFGQGLGLRGPQGLVTGERGSLFIKLACVELQLIWISVLWRLRRKKC